MNSRHLQVSLLPLFLITTLLLGSLPSCIKDTTGREETRYFVFALTNNAERNAVITYRRDTADGSLTYVSTEPTDGLGTSAPLSSQGPITISRNGKWLLAVNAASNSVSVFSVDGNGAHFRSATASGGVRPISVCVHDDLVYVLHSGENGTLTGFHLSEKGTLSAISDSKQILGDSSTNPAQASFALNGSMLVVTLKAVNKLLAFPVNSTGKLSAPYSVNSRGIFPYGFAVSESGSIYASEGKSGSMSVYKVTPAGISAVEGPFPTYQLSACWAGLTPNGKFVYILNANSASITGFHADQTGYPLLNSNGITAQTGTMPIDIQLSPDSRFAYVLGFADHVISCYRIDESGALSRVEDRFTNPPGTTGICLQ